MIPKMKSLNSLFVAGALGGQDEIYKLGVGTKEVKVEVDSYRDANRLNLSIGTTITLPPHDGLSFKTKDRIQLSNLEVPITRLIFLARPNRGQQFIIENVRIK